MSRGGWWLVAAAFDCGCAADGAVDEAPLECTQFIELEACEEHGCGFYRGGEVVAVGGVCENADAEIGICYDPDAGFGGSTAPSFLYHEPTGRVAGFGFTFVGPDEPARVSPDWRGCGCAEPSPPACWCTVAWNTEGCGSE